MIEGVIDMCCDHRLAEGLTGACGGCYEQRGEYIGNLQKEIERLREQYDKHLDDRAAWQAEIQRLKAVLDAEARNRERILDEQEAEIEKLQAKIERLVPALMECALADTALAARRVAKDALENGDE